MSKIRAIIFDLDGVISDTQKFHCQVEAKLLRDLGVNLTDKELLKKYAGVSDREVFGRLLPENKVKKILDRKYEILIKTLEGNVQPIPGVIKLIKNFKNNSFKLAVASSGRKNFVKFVLSEFKIKNYFHYILAQEDVKFAKPNPEIYLKAAKLLNESPKNCLVIEDAPAGIKAAKLAKMNCLAITTNFQKKFLKEADKIINSFNEITMKIIEEI